MSETGVIEIQHHYAQPPAAVWRALTDPALLARWWAPGDIRAEAGHRFELDMGPYGKQACEVLEVEPERLLVYRFGEGRLDTVITWRLTPEDGGTRLDLRQEGFDLASPMGRQALEGMKPGWPKVLERLGAMLAEAA